MDTTEQAKTEKVAIEMSRIEMRVGNVTVLWPDDESMPFSSPCPRLFYDGVEMEYHSFTLVCKAGRAPVFEVDIPVK